MVEGFFEWTAERIPFVFRPKMKKSESTQEVLLHLFLAGLYSHDGSIILLTRESIGDAKKAHNRMPVLLDDNEIDTWLNCEKYKYEDIQGEILDEGKEKWKSTFCYQLTPLVNNSKNKAANVLMKSDEYDTVADKSTIKKFFGSGKKSTQVTHEDPFEGLRRGDETDEEEDLEEDETANNYKEEQKVEEEKPKSPEKKIKIELIHSPRQAKKVSKGKNSQKKVEEIKSGEEDNQGSRIIDNELRNKELKNVLEDIKLACEEAGIDLGRQYTVKQTVLVVEKKKDGEEGNKENLEKENGKESKGKKRKSYEGEEDNNVYLPSAKKMKESPLPLSQRNAQR